jgi:hypothetical protein
MNDKTIKSILLARYNNNLYGILIALDVVDHSDDIIELFQLV